MYADIHTSIHACTQTYIHTYMHTYLLTSIHPSIHTSIHPHMHIHTASLVDILVFTTCLVPVGGDKLMYSSIHVALLGASASCFKLKCKCHTHTHKGRKVTTMSSNPHSSLITYQSHTVICWQPPNLLTSLDFHPIFSGWMIGFQISSPDPVDLFLLFSAIRFSKGSYWVNPFEPERVKERVKEVFHDLNMIRYECLVNRDFIPAFAHAKWLPLWDSHCWLWLPASRWMRCVWRCWNTGSRRGWPESDGDLTSKKWEFHQKDW